MIVPLFLYPIHHLKIKTLMKNCFIFKRSTLYTVMIFLLSACSIHQKKNDEEIHTIAINEAVINKKNLVLSDFVSGNVKYVQLESKNECLLGRRLRLYSNDSLIVAFDHKEIYLFDKETGRFLRKISHYGRDPEGYKEATIYSFPYNELRNTVYTKGWELNSYYEYSISGRLISKKILRFGDWVINSMTRLNDTSYVGYVWNWDGKQKTKLVVFNERYEKLKTYPQPLSFELKQINVFPWDGWFYQFNNEVNFYEAFTDTIYQVTQESLVPRFIFSRDVEFPYRVQSIFESNRYLLFTFYYLKNLNYSIYDKVKKETKISDETGEIINDLDNFLPFNFSSVNNREEIIGFQEAFKILNWFKENPEKAGKLPAHLQKFKQLNEMDNPVVMMVRLKK